MEILIVVIVGSFAFGILYTIAKSGKREREQEKEREREISRQKLERKEKESEYISKYGEITKVFPIKSLESDNNIYLFEQRKKLIIMDKVFDFKDFISCELSEEVIQGESHTVTSIDKQDLAMKEFWEGGLMPSRKDSERAAIKAKRITTTYKDPDIKKYSITINVINLLDPIISLHPDTETIAKRIVGLINAIIAQNNQQ